MAKTSKKNQGEILPKPRPIAPVTLDVMNAQTVNPYNIGPVYANNAAVLIGPHDIRMVFSEIVMSGAAQAVPSVELRANVTMSPTLFKAFAGAVATTLEQFEKQFGEISWPPKNQ